MKVGSVDIRQWLNVLQKQIKDLAALAREARTRPWKNIEGSHI